MNDLVASPSTKSEQIHIRIKQDIKHDLQILADSRGLTMSAFVHSLIVQAIRRERAENGASAFAQVLAAPPGPQARTTLRDHAPPTPPPHHEHEPESLEELQDILAALGISQVNFFDADKYRDNPEALRLALETVRYALQQAIDRGDISPDAVKKPSTTPSGRRRGG
jgi:hypothetical protein